VSLRCAFRCNSKSYSLLTFSSFSMQLYLHFCNAAVLLSSHPSCTTRQRPKHCTVCTLRNHNSRSYHSLESSLSSKVRHGSMGGRRSSDSSTFVSFELSDFLDTIKYSRIDGATTTQSKMCRSTTSSSELYECNAVCDGKRVSTACLWGLDLQWTRRMYAHMHGGIAQTWLSETTFSSSDGVAYSNHWYLLYNQLQESLFGRCGVGVLLWLLSSRVVSQPKRWKS
jgi:hypothetical protein